MDQKGPDIGRNCRTNFKGCTDLSGRASHASKVLVGRGRWELIHCGETIYETDTVNAF